AEADVPGCSSALDYCGFAPGNLPERIHNSWMLDNIHSLAFTVTPPPNVSSLNHTTGGPGDLVVIQGSGLAGILEVTFGGFRAAVVSRDSDDAITVQVPAGTSGQTVDVAVWTVVGSATLTQAFSYT